MVDDKQQQTANSLKADEPNLSHWAKLEYLTTLEATSLSLGGDPSKFASPDNLHGQSVEQAMDFSLFKERYERVERVVGTAPGVAPDKLIEWMDENGLNVPEGFRVAVAARRSRHADTISNLTDALTEIKKLKGALEQTEKDRDAFKAQANKKSLRSLDRIAVGIAMAKYKWDPKAQRGNNFAERIADDLRELAKFHHEDGPWRQTLGTDADTVRKHLRSAFDRLNGDSDD